MKSGKIITWTTIKNENKLFKAEIITWTTIKNENKLFKAEIFHVEFD